MWNSPRTFFELIQHGLDQRRMECVGNHKLRSFYTRIPQLIQNNLNIGRISGDSRVLRRVECGDGH